MRVSVARRNLFSDPTRLAISVGGVAVAIILIIVLLGIYGGSSEQMSAYINNVDEDLWVAQAGSPPPVLAVPGKWPKAAATRGRVR